jgi:hypothetical protein
MLKGVKPAWHVFLKNSLDLWEIIMNRKAFPASLVQINLKLSTTFGSAVRSTLLIFFLFFPLTFLHLFFHEGGHALLNLSKGVPVTFIYAHPFSFVGYARPMVDYYNIFQHISGYIVELLVSAVIFILLWQRRSRYTLPFLMVLPWVMTYNGIGDILDILGKSGDFYNLINITGLPASIFYIASILTAVMGIFFFISLFPLLGLAPEDKKSLLVLPVGMLLYSAFGVMIAHLFVPSSPIDIRYHLAAEIIASASFRPLFMGLISLMLAVIYFTLYRQFYKKLPSSLRVEQANLTWKGLLYPGLLFAVSIILGLIVIL